MCVCGGEWENKEEKEREVLSALIVKEVSILAYPLCN